MTQLQSIHQRNQRIRADLILILVSLLWGSAFVVQRVAAAQKSVFLFNGLRFVLGALVLIPFARHQIQRLNSREVWSVVLLGGLLFSGAAFQQWGMIYTTAGNAGFITGLYVVLIPILLTVGWKQPPRRSIWLASSLAVIGLFLLSTGGRLTMNAGDGLELVGAVFWAFHVILLGRLVKRVRVLQLAIGQYLVCGLISLVLGFGMEGYPTAGLHNAWWTPAFFTGVVYTGIFSIGLGYTLQAVGQKVAPPSDAAILLSLEAVFAALFGWLFLGESLLIVQIIGCVLMFTGMLFAQGEIFLR